MLELGTVITVLITLGVVALVTSAVGVMRLNRKVEDLELSRMDSIDMEENIHRTIERVENELSQYVSSTEKDINRRIDDEQTMSKSSLNRLERSLDKRFDNVWTDVHKLDDSINPNKDLLKDQFNL